MCGARGSMCGGSVSIWGYELYRECGSEYIGRWGMEWRWVYTIYSMKDRGERDE